MWYRESIMSMNRKTYEAIKGKSYQEMCDLFWGEESYFHINDLWDKVANVYSLWKYCEHDIEQYKSPLFDKFDAGWDDWECVLLSKEGFAAVIQHYADKVVGLYARLIDKWDIKEYRKHCVDYMEERTRYLPYRLDTWEEVTTSWKYEYSVFEMVRLYKSFDHDNNILIYYWW